MRATTAAAALMLCLAASHAAGAQACVVPKGYSTPDPVIGATCAALDEPIRRKIAKALSSPDDRGRGDDAEDGELPYDEDFPHDADFQRYWAQIPPCPKVRRFLSVTLRAIDATPKLTAEEKTSQKRAATAKIVAVVSANRALCTK